MQMDAWTEGGREGYREEGKMMDVWVGGCMD